MLLNIFVLERLDCWRLMRLTFKLSEEASRNACYSKHCVTVYSLDCEWLLWSHDTCSGMNGRLPIYAVKQLLPLSLIRSASFLLALAVWLWLDFNVLVSAGMLGAAVLIGQSVPSLSPSNSGPNKQNQEEEECTSGGFYCNHPQFALELYNSKRKHKNSYCFTRFHCVWIVHVIMQFLIISKSTG